MTDTQAETVPQDQTAKILAAVQEALLPFHLQDAPFKLTGEALLDVTQYLIEAACFLYPSSAPGPDCLPGRNH